MSIPKLEVGSGSYSPIQPSEEPNSPGNESVPSLANRVESLPSRTTLEVKSFPWNKTGQVALAIIGLIGIAMAILIVVSLFPSTGFDCSGIPIAGPSLVSASTSLLGTIAVGGTGLAAICLAGVLKLREEKTQAKCKELQQNAIILFGNDGKIMSAEQIEECLTRDDKGNIITHENLFKEFKEASLTDRQTIKRLEWENQRLKNQLQALQK